MTKSVLFLGTLLASVRVAPAAAAHSANFKSPAEGMHFTRGQPLVIFADIFDSRDGKGFIVCPAGQTISNTSPPPDYSDPARKAVCSGGGTPMGFPQFEIWQKTQKVSQVLTIFRDRYTPAAGSAIIDTGDPQDNDSMGRRTDIGAIDLGGHDQDKLGKFSPQTTKPPPSDAGVAGASGGSSGSAGNAAGGASGAAGGGGRAGGLPGSGGGANAEAGGDDGGCGCKVVRSERATLAMILGPLGLAVGLALRRARRRRGVRSRA